MRNYTAIVLSEDVQDSLVKVAKPLIPKEWSSRDLGRFGHHATLSYDSNPIILGLQHGEVKIIKLMGLARNARTCAFIGYDEDFTKMIHISMGTKFLVSPLECNILTEKDIIMPYFRTVAGRISEGYDEFWNLRK